MWIWKQKTGKLLRNKEKIDSGESAPIAAGMWTVARLLDGAPLVERVLALEHVATGAEAFVIMRNDAGLPATAPDNCIILPLHVCHMIWLSGDHELKVMAS